MLDYLHCGSCLPFLIFFIELAYFLIELPFGYGDEGLDNNCKNKVHKKEGAYHDNEYGIESSENGGIQVH